MFVVQSSIWVIVYPLALLAFLVRLSCQLISFLFHSPVDIWVMIGKGIEEAEKETR